MQLRLLRTLVLALLFAACLLSACTTTPDLHARLSRLSFSEIALSGAADTFVRPLAQEPPGPNKVGALRSSAKAQY